MRDYQQAYVDKIAMSPKLVLKSLGKLPGAGRDPAKTTRFLDRAERWAGWNKARRGRDLFAETQRSGRGMAMADENRVDPNSIAFMRDMVGNATGSAGRDALYRAKIVPFAAPMNNLAQPLQKPVLTADRRASLTSPVNNLAPSPQTPIGSHNKGMRNALHRQLKSRGPDARLSRRNLNRQLAATTRGSSLYQRLGVGSAAQHGKAPALLSFGPDVRSGVHEMSHLTKPLAGAARLNQKNLRTTLFEEQRANRVAANAIRNIRASNDPRKALVPGLSETTESPLQLLSPTIDHYGSSAISQLIPQIRERMAGFTPVSVDLPAKYLRVVNKF